MSGTRRTGFTLVELMVVVAIIAVVIAVTLPFFRHAKEAASITDTIATLRHLGQAMAIYRADWETDPTSPDSDHLGFPPDGSPEWKRFAFLPKRPLVGDAYGGIQYLRSEQDTDEWGWTQWRTHFSQCRSSSVWMADLGHNPFNVVREPARLKVGIGLQLDGAVRVQRGYGVILDVNWWGCKAR